MERIGDSQNFSDFFVAENVRNMIVSAGLSFPGWNNICRDVMPDQKVGKKANPRFLSYFLKTQDFWEYMHGVLGDKSAQPNASAKMITQVKLNLPTLPEQRAIAHILGLNKYSIVIPPPEIAAVFGRFANASMTKIACNAEESNSLATVRDALLPKLLSGEMRVKNVEKLGKEIR